MEKRILMLDELTWGPRLTAKCMREKLKVVVDHVKNVEEARSCLVQGHNYGLALIEPFQLDPNSPEARKYSEELRELIITMKDQIRIYVVVNSTQNYEDIRKDYGLVPGKHFNEYLHKDSGRSTLVKIVELWEKLKA